MRVGAGADGTEADRPDGADPEAERRAPESLESIPRREPHASAVHRRMEVLQFCLDLRVQLHRASIRHVFSEFGGSRLAPVCLPLHPFALEPSQDLPTMGGLPHLGRSESPAMTTPGAIALELDHPLDGVMSSPLLPGAGVGCFAAASGVAAYAEVRLESQVVRRGLRSGGQEQTHRLEAHVITVQHVVGQRVAPIPAGRPPRYALTLLPVAACGLPPNPHVCAHRLTR